ncbi:hypothetical protein WDW89_04700 [Deltaproteobacteria bacterium TL4]
MSARQEIEQKRHQQRLESILREYHSKVQDLRQKYEITIECSIEQILELIVPVQRLDLLLLRRKGKRLISLDWNPLIRKLDQPQCESGYDPSPNRVVCDEQLHITAPEGNAPCNLCGKSYCRACYSSKCPKCN